MSNNTRTNPHAPTAACLTPPAAGGIAVIEVIGWDAATVVNPLLRARRPINISTMDPGELRLCQIVDAGQVLDDALIAARPLPDGATLVDISVHGGPRIVQRVLLALKSAGASIVEADAHAWLLAPVANLLEQEAFELLVKAKTRAVASWLARAPAALAAEAQRIEGLLAGGQIEAGQAALEDLAGRFGEAQYLIRGVRVVLTGEPNSGKSTLANALAGAEHSIVSDVAGTTRDWVELPAAIDGVPVTLVDTAGIRHTDDALEQESIRRSQDQLATADIVVQVVDRSAPPQLSDTAGKWVRQPGPLAMGHPLPREVLVLNKCDLPQNAGFVAAGGQQGIQVSARTGEGLADLRRYLLEGVGLTGWTDRPARPFSQRQHQACRHALAAIRTGRPEADLTCNLLRQGSGTPDQQASET